MAPCVCPCKLVRKTLGYYQEKTDDLLAFGVGKVVWIFTETTKLMSAAQGEAWVINSWQDEVELMPGLRLQLAEVVAKIRPGDEDR